MENLEKIFNDLCNRNSDINEHLPVLRKYAEQCDHVTEMGVRWVVSTYAFLAGRPKKMISYDIDHVSRWGVNLNELIDIAHSVNVDFSFNVADSILVDIEPTDLLFIDTWHAFMQLKIELYKHASNVKKYIILHDTALNAHAHVDSDTHYVELPEIEPGDHQKEGLLPAIDDFLKSHPEWKIKEVYENNNGLTILERIK